MLKKLIANNSIKADKKECKQRSTELKVRKSGVITWICHL